MSHALARLLSRERLGAYLAHCGDFHAGIGLYRWNAAVSAAIWSSLSHVEVALRNAMSDSLAARHQRLGRGGSWLDDPASELDARMRRRTSLWPDLAGAFPGAPDRRRATVEEPVARLHDLRNRIAHHQRIWNHDVPARYGDGVLMASRVPALLRARPLL